MAKPRRKAAEAMPPAPPAEERDYLVIFEEPDPYGLPADDTLVLDIEQSNPQRPEVDVQQNVAIELTNTTSRLGTVGFALSCLGGLAGVGLMVTYLFIYPQNWHGSPDTVRTMILAAVVTLLLLIVGTLLTHYGRRIQARGRLSDVRIIEKASQNTAHLE